jgi:hypothetical protein
MDIGKEHVVLIKEPGNQYVSFVTPESGTGEGTAEAIIEKLVSMNVNLQNLKLLGGDGCRVNTGYLNGAMRKIEEHINRPIGRDVCLYHFVELPTERVFEELFGKGVGPRNYGPILTKNLESCHEKKIVDFAKVPANLPKIDCTGLSRDQKYLFMMAEGIQSGKIDDKLASSIPGRINHARWLTTASRTLRHYASDPNPSEEMKLMVKYIMEIYVPFWNAVRMDNSVSKGASHLLNFIKLTK